MFSELGVTGAHRGGRDGVRSNSLNVQVFF